MGMTVVCDSCGVDMQFIDKFSVQSTSIERGSIQADLCPDCAKPFWDLPVGQKLISDAKKAMEDEATRRAVIEEQLRLAEAQKLVDQNQE